MSTRACYTFCDPNGSRYHVYKHHDGYPYHGQRSAIDGVLSECGGLVWIENAKPFAWELPRFEADDYAAAFVAANKPIDGGGVRLIRTPEPWEFSSDSEYWYKVSVSSGGPFPQVTDVYVEVYHVDWWQPYDRRNERVSEGMLLDLLEKERKKVKISA